MRRSVVVAAAITAVVLTAGNLWRLTPQPNPSEALAALPLAGGISQPSVVDRALPAAQDEPGDVGSPEEMAPEAAEPEPMATEPPAGESAREQPAVPPAASPGMRPVPTSGVLHGVSSHSWTVIQGDAPPARRIEFWVDLETGDARLAERDASTSLEQVSVRNGDRQTLLLPSEKRASTRVASDPQAPYLNEIRDRLLGTRMAIDRGELQVVGEDVIDGQPAVRVTRPGNPPEFPDLFLSKEHGLLLKEVAYRLTPTGGREEVQTHLVSYQTVETQSRGQVAADVFSPNIPSDWEWVTTRGLDPSSASGFRSFDLYWLGAQYSGLGVARMIHDEVVGTSGRMTVVVIEYLEPPLPENQAPPQTPPNQLTIVQRTPPTGEEATARAQMQGEPVTVQGRRGSLFVPPPPGQQGAQGQQEAQGQQGPAIQPPTVLEIPMSGSLIVIYGRDRSQVTQAGRDLLKLN